MFDLWLFTTDVALARHSVEAGVKGIIIDWECVGKEERQKDNNLECNQDTIEDLRRIRKSLSSKVICRVNPMDIHTKKEIESAIHAGADVIFLPMVKTAEQIESFLKLIDNRAEAGILVENKEAVANAHAMASLPIGYVYIGLNDLSISSGSRNIFEAVADGTVQTMREIFSEQRFGFGGVTVIDRGSPVPFHLLLKEMSRLQCDFGFLRRSFKRDIIGRNISSEVQKILNAYKSFSTRTAEKKRKDRMELIGIIEKLVNENTFGLTLPELRL